MFKQLKSSIKSAANTALATIGIPEVQKTFDPRYLQAKQKYKQYSSNLVDIIGQLSTMQSQLNTVSKLASSIGTNFSKFSEGFPIEYQNHAITAESFGKQFESITLNFFKPRADALILRPLSLFKGEIDRLHVVKKQRKESRKKYDSLRANFEAMQKAKKSAQDLAKTEAELNAAKSEYEKYNTDFIESIQKIELTDDHLMKLIVVFSQYLMQILIELQKFRTTYPEEIFADNFRDNEETTPYQSLQDLVFVD